ncbi:MAG: acyl-CoA dehydrogenase family protein [Gallionella sp.]
MATAPTPDPVNIPEFRFTNLLDEDPLGEAFWEHWFGAGRYNKLRKHFSALGESGVLATELSARADKQVPVLQTHDARGLRIERVIQHPDYRELERLSYGRGIVGIKYQAEFLAKHRAYRHLAGFGAGYYFAQSEIGLYCPICMTDGVGRVLERQTKGPQTPLYEMTITHLSAGDPEQRWQGAMFLTEKQGGSDVGANAVTATRQDKRWLLNGDKWFCSNVAADAILALARMPEGEPGTRGLGLFLVLRREPAGNSATIRINRLKDKLGVRSMPTGEVTFENTEAFLVAGENEGFKQMAEMLKLSRLYNAVASVAGMRRAVLEALKYGAGRMAFGRRLDELPLWRAAMADLVAEHLGIFVLVFTTVRALDLADNGDEEARKLVRIAIPMAKALSGKLAVFAVSEAMEAIGGNAYIEETILPRLLRDCQVLPIWEGTTHILTLDALRAIHKEGSHVALFARIRLALENAKQLDTGPVQARLEDDVNRLDTLLKLPAELQQREARQWLEGTGRTLTLALLLENAAHPPLREACLAAYQRLSVRPTGVMPVCHGNPAALADTEAVLLRSAASQDHSDSVKSPPAPS